jgi:large subunit ribosomal protein L3
MGALHRPRFGSLQFWPRKRAEKELPSLNWKVLESKNLGKTLLGTIAYKAGMCSVIVKDSTMHSLTKGKTIVIPSTILECPPIKILGIRFYKGNKVAFDILAPNLDKELKRKLKFPKKESSLDVNPENFDNVHVLAYTDSKKTGIKKTPDIAEIAIKGKSAKEKFESAKALLGKEININDVFDKNQLVDVHAVTKAKGLEGPVKRFGISFKQHKSEKGVRRPGSLGPWHPARVTFKTPISGQLGYFTRVQYNNKLLDFDSISKSKLDGKVFMNYGPITTKYCAIKGSVGGPQKRAIFLTFSSRPTKDKEKENFEVVKFT